MTAADARTELWARFDQGHLTPDQLEIRLRLVDEADAADPSAVQAAVDGPIPQGYRVKAATKRLAVAGAGLVLAALLVIGAVTVAAGRGSDSNSTGGGSTDPGGPFFTVVPVPGQPVPLPAPVPDELVPTTDCAGTDLAAPAPGQEAGSSSGVPTAPETTVGC